MKPTIDQVDAGQAIYSSRVLSAYDVWVLGVSNRFIWKCPTEALLKHYNLNVSGNHLEVGVGTGYFPDHCRFPVEAPRIALMDLNPNTLAFASKRIARYAPEQYLQNILEPIEHSIIGFDSVAMNYLLHCVPGPITEKAIAFDHIQSVLNPNAVIFGSTIVQEGVPRSLLAKSLMGIYNKKGIFSNVEDGLSALEASLNQRFSDVVVSAKGCVALFSARNR